MAKTTAVKKALGMALGISAALLLTGCWNYRGISETIIVSGIAIDRDERTGIYKLTYEIVDLTRDIKEAGIQPRIVESQGRTLLDAARNAKKRLSNKLYFGNAQIIVINQGVAREGISPLIDWFLRDGECRGTIAVAVSQQQTARDILAVEAIGQRLSAYETKKIIDEDQRITGTTQNTELYAIFNTLKEEGRCLALPAVRNVTNDGQSTMEVNGVAIFKQDRLIGFLTPDETKSLLFATDGIEGGVLTLSLDREKGDDISLEISQSKTQISCSYADGRAKAHIKIRTEAYIDEIGVEMDLVEEESLAHIEALAAREIEHQLGALIEKMQTIYGADVFGFGRRIYKRTPRLWREIQPEWDVLFRELEPRIECEVVIVNTAFLLKV